jgi:hypothetical protein
MTWVPEHGRIEENEVADQFRRTGSEYSTLGSEAASAFWKCLLTGKLGPDEQKPFKIIKSICGHNMQKDFLEKLQPNKPCNYFS